MIDYQTCSSPQEDTIHVSVDVCTQMCRYGLVYSNKLVTGGRKII